MYSIGELRPGMAIQIDGVPYLVTRSQHSKQARGLGVAKTTVKNLLTGAVVPKTFQGNERLEPAEISYSRAQYLYADETGCHFMDGTTFEQFFLEKESVEEQLPYMIEGTDVDIQNFEDKPIAVKIAPKVELKVVSTTPGVRGNTAQGGSKPATMETGAVIQVPLFINEGDKIRVNTETGEYAERAS